MTHARLTKHPADRVWAGVCAGIAHWLGVDPVLIRLAWLAWAVFGDTGTAILAYVVLMMVIPTANRAELRPDARTRGPFDAVHPTPPVPTSAAPHPASRPASAAPPTIVGATADPDSHPTGPRKAPSPTADELGDVVLSLLDATVNLAASVASAALRAVRAGFVNGQGAHRGPRPYPSTPGTAPATDAATVGAPATDRSPAAVASMSATAPSTAHAGPATAPHVDGPHLESDEERLQRQVRARLDQQVVEARGVVGASKAQLEGRERAGRRHRLRQLAGFGVLALGVWGLTATLDVFPHALATLSASPLAGTAVVTAAALIGLGTYLLWTAVRRHV